MSDDAKVLSVIREKLIDARLAGAGAMAGGEGVMRIASELLNIISVFDYGANKPSTVYTLAVGLIRSEFRARFGRWQDGAWIAGNTDAAEMDASIGLAEESISRWLDAAGLVASITERKEG